MGFSCWCTVLVCSSSLHDKLICQLYMSFFLEGKNFFDEFSTFILSPIPWLLISLPLFSSNKLHFKHFTSNRQPILSIVSSITKISTGICFSKIHCTLFARYTLLFLVSFLLFISYAFSFLSSVCFSLLFPVFQIFCSSIFLDCKLKIIM
jgi:hypothetical protein